MPQYVEYRGHVRLVSGKTNPTIMVKGERIAANLSTLKTTTAPDIAQARIRLARTPRMSSPARSPPSAKKCKDGKVPQGRNGRCVVMCKDGKVRNMTTYRCTNPPKRPKSPKSPSPVAMVLRPRVVKPKTLTEAQKAQQKVLKTMWTNRAREIGIENRPVTQAHLDVGKKLLMAMRNRKAYQRQTQVKQDRCNARPYSKWDGANRKCRCQDGFDYNKAGKSCDCVGKDGKHGVIVDGRCEQRGNLGWIGNKMLGW